MKVHNITKLHNLQTLPETQRIIVASQGAKMTVFERTIPTRYLHYRGHNIIL